MQGRGIRLLRALALVALGAVLATAVVAVAKKKPPAPAKPQPSPAISVRDTGVGLARIGAHGTVGAADYVPVIRSYFDSGSYAADLADVGSRAKAFMVKQAKAIRDAAKRKCKTIRRKKPKRKCNKNPPLAVALDIDETSLSNYTELNTANFTNAQGALILAIASADSPAIGPTLDLYREARARGIAVFAVTGRPDSVGSFTRDNLNAAGYTDLAGIYFKPSGEPTIAFKSASRAAIEQQGYRIVANVGDQESDLEGGHADRSFKLPNPFYFIE